jgi:hypothetical protein
MSLEIISMWFACSLTRKITPKIQRHAESNECNSTLKVAIVMCVNRVLLQEAGNAHS